MSSLYNPHFLHLRNCALYRELVIKRIGYAMELQKSSMHLINVSFIPNSPSSALLLLYSTKHTAIPLQEILSVNKSVLMHHSIDDIALSAIL